MNIMSAKDTKINLNEEALFAEKPYVMRTINTLNKKGIFTVEEFINTDSRDLATDGNRRKQFRAFQEILKYKYLGTPMVIDVLLDKEYTSTNDSISNDLVTLGFGNSLWDGMAENFYKSKGPFKIIDFIMELDNSFDYLKFFYIEYYNSNNKLRKKNINGSTPSYDKDKDYLESLKNELVNVLLQRKKLDEHISLLLAQISKLEGVIKSHARK